MAEGLTYLLIGKSSGLSCTTKWGRFADGTILERWVGGAFIYVAGKRTIDDVVFGEPGDLELLGSRTLAGLNFRIEPVTKQLVDAGPAPAAVAKQNDKRVKSNPRWLKPIAVSVWSASCAGQPERRRQTLARPFSA